MVKRFITLEGRNTVHDALLSRNKVVSVLISTSVINDPRIREIEALARKDNISVQRVSSDQIERESGSTNAQGVIAQMELAPAPTIKEMLDSKPNPFLLLFNTIDYEQNLGAIMRTAWAAGVDAVVVSNSGVHEVTPVVAKVSQGAVAYVPLIGVSLFQALTTIKEYAIPIVGVEVGLGSDYSKQNLLGPIVLVFGGESAGLTEPLKKYCDLFIHIPMTTGVASLNVSVASALIAFEKTRQERL